MQFMEQNTNRAKSILVVDDEPSIRQTLKLLLSMDGHTVALASNGEEAFSLYTSSNFDLVITDFQMPGMKGDELAAQIKQISPSQPILMITAYSHHLEPSYSPVDAILIKPFRVDEFRQAMTTLLAPGPQAPLLATA